MPPESHLRDRLASDGVGFEPGLGLALLGLDRARVRDDLRGVAVGRLTDVPAVADVGAEAAPRLFEGVEDLVLGDRLVDPALQHALRPAARERYRLVGREQRDVGVLEFSFDREPLEGSTSHPRDALANHHVEAAVVPRRLVEQVDDAAGAGDRDVEPLVALPLSAFVEFETAGLDVEEVGRDDPGRGQRVLAVRQLPDDGLARVLLVFGRGASEEGDADLVVQQGTRHPQRGHGVVGQARRRRCPVMCGHAR
ncbi:hypothetical protein [Amycolatopsis pretoriensis]|uniref:hypothetical protein n=1 Tax=Amycolatopsis pretoriensis TaxID=218821 RepID=UPI001FC914B6|nr:hypothetical protein [Amycolatopsis pretoriensis]